MILTVSPWVVWAVLSLALFGLVFLWRAAREGLRDLWAWVRYDRVTPLLEDDEGPLEELPPERSWQEMTADQPIVVDRLTLWHGAERERRAPWYELQQRDAYEACGLDYPSGLMARVRELTP